jgi:hypothetical protein
LSIDIELSRNDDATQRVPLKVDVTPASANLECARAVERLDKVVSDLLDQAKGRSGEEILVAKHPSLVSIGHGGPLVESLEDGKNVGHEAIRRKA